MNIERIALTLSIIGGICLMITWVLPAHYVWLVGDILWFIHFSKLGDRWAQKLFGVYVLQVLIGIWMWS